MANATRHLIAQALEDLLRQKTLDKITVKEIVEKSGVNRQTFYYNFEDIYALVEWIFEEKTRALAGQVDLEADWKELIPQLSQNLLEYKQLILNAYHSLNRVHLERYLKNWLRPYVAHVVDDKAQAYRVTETEKAFICNCYVAVFVGIALEWIESNMSGNLISQMDMFIKLVDGSLESILQKFSQESAPTS